MHPMKTSEGVGLEVVTDEAKYTVFSEKTGSLDWYLDLLDSYKP
jgi:flagellum-specific peptidoglycan hydrolase FlgJ